MAATGVAGSRPPAISSAAMAPRWATPISTTIVPPTLASARQSTSRRRRRRRAVAAVAGDDRDRGGHAADRDRDAGGGRRGHGRGDAGHDLERHAGVGERRGPPRRRARTRTGRRPSAARPPGSLAASWTSRVLISSWGTPRPGRLPTSISSASGRARASTPSPTRASCTTTSASATSRAARTVSSSGSPGPAPTRARSASPSPARRRTTGVRQPRLDRRGADLVGPGAEACRRRHRRGRRLSLSA